MCRPVAVSLSSAPIAAIPLSRCAPPVVRLVRRIEATAPYRITGPHSDSSCMSATRVGSGSSPSSPVGSGRVRSAGIGKHSPSSGCGCGRLVRRCGRHADLASTAATDRRAAGTDRHGGSRPADPGCCGDMAADERLSSRLVSRMKPPAVSSSLESVQPDVGASARRSASAADPRPCYGSWRSSSAGRRRAVFRGNHRRRGGHLPAVRPVARRWAAVRWGGLACRGRPEQAVSH